jgi:putative tryptophan/tyrosine transport system substrate-binding protein
MGASAAGLAAKAASKTVPVVFITSGDPIKLGLVSSFNRPTGNLTGVSILTGMIVEKHAEMLHEAVPKAALVAFLVHPNSPATDADTGRMQLAVSALGQKLLVVKAGTESELEAAFATFAQQQPGGLVVDTDQFFTNRRAQIVELAAGHALPAIYPSRQFAAAGGLMSYGPDLADAYRQCGAYAARILKGEKPTDLPVMQATKFEFVINLKTARALGLTFPITLLGRADEVIE